MLYNYKKFDIRVFALVTANNEIYFYKNGYVRASCNPYHIKNRQLVSHLNNMWLQDFYSKEE